MDCLFPNILSISFIIVFKDRRHRKVSIEDIDNVVTSAIRKIHFPTSKFGYQNSLKITHTMNIFRMASAKPNDR